MLCFKSKKNTQDYLDEINGDYFRCWLEGVLPKLKDRAVIVMDDAPYHCVRKEKCPTSQWTNQNIIEWLENKGELIDRSMIKVQLMEIVRRLRPMYSKYVVDEMVLEHNKVVLRLPPYHHELNPAWSVVRHYVKSNTFQLSNDQNVLQIEGTEKIDVDLWKKCICQAINEEEKLWNMDFIVDELMEKEDSPNVMIIDDPDDEL